MVRIFRGTVSCLSVMVLLVADAGATDPTDELLLALKDWEAAAADVRQPLPDDALATYRGTLNAHEFEAAAELLGPVSARRLVEEYRWTLARQDSGDMTLHGVPRDATTSLFFARVEVRLDGTTHQPVSIQFFAGDGEPRPTKIIAAASAAMAPPNAPHRSDIELVASVTEVPDEPAAPQLFNLESILKRWQESVGRIETAEIRFHRYVYDHVLLGESRGTGRLLFETPNLGAYEIEPVDTATDPRPARTDGREGKYTLQPDRAMTCHWNGTQVWIIHPDQNSYDVCEIPNTTSDEDRFAWRFWSPWKSPGTLVPGLVDVSDHFLKRYEWKLVRDDDRGLLLQATPTSDRDRSELKVLQVMIDRNSFQTKATRTVNATGTRETTHVFQYVSVNDHRVVQQSWVPDLSGLSLGSTLRNTNASDAD
jgi:hypothetical protein